MCVKKTSYSLLLTLASGFPARQLVRTYLVARPLLGPGSSS